MVYNCSYVLIITTRDLQVGMAGDHLSRILAKKAQLARLPPDGKPLDAQGALVSSLRNGPYGAGYGFLWGLIGDTNPSSYEQQVL